MKLTNNIQMAFDYVSFESLRGKFFERELQNAKILLQAVGKQKQSSFLIESILVNKKLKCLTQKFPL